MRHSLLKLEGTTVELNGCSSNKAEDGRGKESDGSNADHDYRRGTLGNELIDKSNERGVYVE